MRTARSVNFILSHNIGRLFDLRDSYLDFEFCVIPIGRHIFFSECFYHKAWPLGLHLYDI